MSQYCSGMANILFQNNVESEIGKSHAGHWRKCGYLQNVENVTSMFRNSFLFQNVFTHMNQWQQHLDKKAFGEHMFME